MIGLLLQYMYVRSYTLHVYRLISDEFYWKETWVAGPIIKLLNNLIVCAFLSNLLLATNSTLFSTR